MGARVPASVAALFIQFSNFQSFRELTLLAFSFSFFSLFAAWKFTTAERFYLTFTLGQEISALCSLFFPLCCITT